MLCACENLEWNIAKFLVSGGFQHMLLYAIKQKKINFGYYFGLKKDLY